MNNQEQFIAMSYEEEINRLTKEVEQLKRQLGMLPSQYFDRKIEEVRSHRTAEDAGCPEPKAQPPADSPANINAQAIRSLDSAIAVLESIKSTLKP